MTRHGFVLGLALALALAACGGSSSETPPPLQPDPVGFHYAGAPLPARDSADAGSDPVTPRTDEDEDPKPRAPAHSTWGGATPPRH